MQPKKKKRSGWSTVIGWLFFILIIARVPLSRLIQSALNGSSGTLSVPPNLVSLLPFAVGGVVVLAIAVSAVRALNGRRGQDERLPTAMSLPTSARASQPSSTPMPPFAGPSTPPFAGPNMPPVMSSARAATPPSPRAFTLPASSQPNLPAPPRFEPIFNPRIVLVGIAGLVVLGALGLMMLGLLVP